MSDKSNPFGIQNTMETGAGDAQLLNDLMAPETASGNPEDVTPIVNEIDTPKSRNKRWSSKRKRYHTS